MTSRHGSRTNVVRSVAVTGVLVAAIVACAPVEQGADADTVARAPWYERSRAIDLTGDGRADTVRLTAEGARPDSMPVRMVFIVDGAEKFREEWGSSYELSWRDPGTRAGARLEPLLRARLDTVLASVRVEPLTGRTPGVMAEDSAILKDISPWPRERIIFSYGFESQPNLFWDAPRERFVRLWSCC